MKTPYVPCPDCDIVQIDPVRYRVCPQCEVAQARPHKPATEAVVLGAAAPAWRLPPQDGREVQKLIRALQGNPKRIRGPMELAWVELPENWQRIRPHLERLCAKDRWHGMTLTHLAQRIQSGAYRVWVWGDFDAVFLTNVFRQADGRLCCSLSWAAGEDALHPDAIYPAIEDYARLNGCRTLQIMGRKGWARVMRGHGFELADQTIAKEL